MSEPILTPVQRRFLGGARTATLATRTIDGGARLVPICFVILGEGEPVLVTSLDEKPKSVADPRRLERVRDIIERPRVDLLVEHWSEDWSELAWLRLEGLAALIEPGDEDHAAAATELREKYPQYAAHALHARPAIRIEILVARSWGRLEP